MLRKETQLKTLILMSRSLLFHLLHLLELRSVPFIMDSSLALPAHLPEVFLEHGTLLDTAMGWGEQYSSPIIKEF